MTATATSYMAAAQEDRIHDLTDKLGEIVGTPEFVDIVEQLEAATPEERPNLVRELGSAEVFREHGIPLPEGLKVAPRAFESPNGASPTEEYAPFGEETLQITVPQPKAQTICVSIGPLGICISIGN